MMTGGTSQLENKTNEIYTLIPEDFIPIIGGINHRKRCFKELRHMQGLQLINYRGNKETLNPSRKDIEEFVAQSAGRDILLAGYNCLIGTGIVGAVLGAVNYFKK